MAIYDISWNQAHKASLAVDDRGQKTWAFASESDRKRYFPDAIKADIERVVDCWYLSLNRREARMLGLTIRVRQA
jgi:hypothetical protein